MNKGRFSCVEIADSCKVFLRQKLGVDKAIGYTVLARLGSTLGSVGTVMLLVHFLNPVQQGYYYTLLSLMALQTVFESGFSVVILQMAAHERIHIQISATLEVVGDERARARLASIFQKAVRWYAVAALCMIVVLTPTGVFFFLRHQQGGATEWLWPWLLAVPSCTLVFLSNPICSFLEGCGYIQQVAKMRLVQAMAGTLFCWAPLVVHCGLFAPAASLFMQGAVGFALVVLYARLLIPLWQYSPGLDAIDWRGEVWSFQWKVAVTSLCNYVTALLFTPIVFALCGPVLAGQFGLTMNIVAAFTNLALPWMSTKAAPFGNLVARGELDCLHAVFFRTLRQSASLFALFLSVCAVGAFWMNQVCPRVMARMSSPSLFAVMLSTVLLNYVVQSEAVYLRSFKKEPFLLQSILVAVLSLCLVIPLTRAFGISGAVYTYFLCTGVLGLVSGTAIFAVNRRAEDVCA